MTVPSSPWSVVNPDVLLWWRTLRRRVVVEIWPISSADPGVGFQEPDIGDVDLADRAGTSRVAIPAYEEGSKIPGAATFLRVAEACVLAVQIRLERRILFIGGHDLAVFKAFFNRTKG